MLHCVRFYSDLDGHPVKPGAPHMGIDYREFENEMEARMFAASFGAAYGTMTDPAARKGGWLETPSTRFSLVKDYRDDA